MARRAATIRRSGTPVRTTRRKPGGRALIIQPELRVGAANDRFEKEADKVADNVMSMGTPHAVTNTAVPPGGHANGLRRKEKGFRGMRASVQRVGMSGNPKGVEDELKKPEDQKLQGKFLDGAGAVQQISRLTQQEEGDKIDKKPLFMAQRACAKCDGEKKDKVQAEFLQRRAGGGGFTASPQVQSNVKAMKSGGTPLSKSTRDFLEPRFGADLEHVRVHTDSRAANTADAIQAKAFTSGNHIAFNKGQFNPGSRDGMRLLAHEVTHTFQQGASVKASRLQRTPGTFVSEQIRRKLISSTVMRSSDEAGEKEESSKGTSGGGNKVFVCSKPVRSTGGLGDHAFFRFGTAKRGAPTLSLMPRNLRPRGKNIRKYCFQGVAGWNYRADRFANDAKCKESTLDRAKVVEFGRPGVYPQGAYCSKGPNSNSYVGWVMKKAGGFVLPPGFTLGLTHAIVFGPPEAGTYGGHKGKSIAFSCRVSKDCKKPKPIDPNEIPGTTL